MFPKMQEELQWAKGNRVLVLRRGHTQKFPKHHGLSGSQGSVLELIYVAIYAQAVLPMTKYTSYESYAFVHI